MRPALLLSFFIGLLGGVCGSLLFSQNSTTYAVSASSDTVRARDIQLVGANGKLLAQLAVSSEGSPALFFFDRNGRNRLNLGVYGDGDPFMVLNDPQEMAAGIFRLVSDEHMPYLIFKHDGRERSIFGINQRQNEPFLIRYNNSGTVMDFGTYP